jgi:hypothetical protein
METTVSASVVGMGVEMRVEVWPSTHLIVDSKKEPMVEYSLNNGIVFIVPERHVRYGSPNFLSRQLDTLMDSGVQRDGVIAKIRLQDTAFQDPFLFALLLDYMKRDAEEPLIVTLRRADTELTDDQWRCLNDMEKFVFQTTDRNPYWSGLTNASFMVDGCVHKMASASDQFTVQITPGCVIVKGSGGFHLCMRTAIVNCTPLNRPRSLLEASVQKMTGMRSSYPFHVDFVSSFFVPHNQIQCRIEGVPVRCEGVIHSDGYMRVEPVDDPANFTWFHFWLTRIFSTAPPHHTLVYGVLSDESDTEIEGNEDVIPEADDGVILGD